MAHAGGDHFAAQLADGLADLGIMEILTKSFVFGLEGGEGRIDLLAGASCRLGFGSLQGAGEDLPSQEVEALWRDVEGGRGLLDLLFAGAGGEDGGKSSAGDGRTAVERFHDAADVDGSGHDAPPGSGGWPWGTLSPRTPWDFSHMMPKSGRVGGEPPHGGFAAVGRPLPSIGPDLGARVPSLESPIPRTGQRRFPPAVPALKSQVAVR